MPENMSGPLAGWKIIDLSRVLGGPYCTQLLGDLGAEIIKIEPPQGDETRDWGPPFKDGQSAYFSGVNRNKESVGLDLSKPEGRSVLLRLLEDADVLVENFKPGSLKKWNLGFDEVLKPKFPKLIHCSITGFGDDGPLGRFPGYDAVLQAMCGLISVNGSPESGPMRIGIPIVDIATGLFAANAILAAAVERGNSGLGQYVEASLFDTGVALQHPHAANWFMSGEPPVLVGNAHTNIVPYDSFPTSTGPIFISIGNNGQFARLCKEIGVPEMADDPKFTNNSDRMEHRDELRVKLEEAFAETDGAALCNTLLASGIPAGPILDMEGILNLDHTRHREMVVEGAGGYRGTGIPIKFDRTPGAVRNPPPRFGENGREVLAKSGFSESEIEKLVDLGVLVEERRKTR
jgi:formyl-CoA transferase